MKAVDLRGVIAANVRAARARRGIRQADVTELVGLPRSTIAAVEAGTRRVYVEEAVALSEALGITLASLFSHGGPEAEPFRRALTSPEDPPMSEPALLAWLRRTRAVEVVQMGTSARNANLMHVEDQWEVWVTNGESGAAREGARLAQCATEAEAELIAYALRAQQGGV